MTELSKLTIYEAREGLKSKTFSSVELTQSCLDSIAAAKVLNTFVHHTPELSLESANSSDLRIAKGEAPSMCGIPIGIKDLFCTKGIPSQAGSRILSGFIPEYESTITKQLWDSGAVMLGKLNMDEFAMGSSNETSVYGDVINPWKEKNNAKNLTPGGSSGGSAAAVAADLCLGATGTDTGGSIRQPAAFVGITGLKPTYGRCSRWGVVAFASSLDQAGPMTKSVTDAAIMLEAMAGHDPKDSTSANIPVPCFETFLTGDIRGKKIGIPKEYRIDGMPDEIEALWSDGITMLKAAGAKIVDISLPHTKYALPAYYVVAPAEASSNLARYDGVRFGHRAALSPGDGITEMYEKTRSEGFGEEVQRRIMIGTYVLSAGFYDAYYNRARKIRTLIKKDFEDAFSLGVEAILTPATPSAAFGLGEMKDVDPIAMYLNDIFTVPVNLAGLPGIAIPAGLDKKGLPLGLQLIGKPWEESELLNTAFALEQAIAFSDKPEKWW
ncbi:MAG: Asp-tRNA(Asn)/Glu-tRNA(Gln) amidotransferase subunit GatA [Proteobacteria bacterium]|jgi:aspartyl-tRNA(Asn)/glutamyl-tRNA(Gln) amidotransferase subunit A|nr:Asp-tRNA(Asn)/Glu-tRNA(Gln) amidotransferase subunit GatA [Pseudomonadota bacterium]